MNNKIAILDINVDIVNYENILQIITESINVRKKVLISYLTVHKNNLAFENPEYGKLLNAFDIVHADGIGLYLASKIIYGKNGLKSRISGSDFYPLLADRGIINKWKFYFYGDQDAILNNIRSFYPSMNIAGTKNGYSYHDEMVINDINTGKPDILIVGLGSPLQEEWIVKNYKLLNTSVIIAVGDGIKVFANCKIRGPKLLRFLGLEWIVRLISDPKRLWRRYLLGIPKFAIRLLFYKPNKV